MTLTSRKYIGFSGKTMKGGEGPTPRPSHVSALHGDGIYHSASGEELWELLMKMSPAASLVN